MVASFVQAFDAEQVLLKTALQPDYELAIKNTSLVSSRGLLASCDIHPEKPLSSHIDTDYLATIAKHSLVQQELQRPITIYLCTDALQSFADSVLPQLQHPFTLVSGDSDLAVSHDSLGDCFNTLLASPLLQAWFAQNRDSRHSKLNSLPIGLDYHSAWANPRLWWGLQSLLPSQQEAHLFELRRQAPCWPDRTPQAYCNWLVSGDRGDRAQCRQQVEEKACFFQQQPISRQQTWQEQSRYGYVLSPSGVGLDCHRTWEAMALGCVPIVKRHHFTDLFRELPALVVEDWSQVTSDFLQEQQEEMVKQRFNFEVLTLAYWRQRINHFASEPPPHAELSLPESAFRF